VISGAEQGGAVGAEGQLLRELCAAMLIEGAPGPELAAWCNRVLSEPGYAERVFDLLDQMFDKRPRVLWRRRYPAPPGLSTPVAVPARHPPWKAPTRA
jgi:hypothetical protein